MTGDYVALVDAPAALEPAARAAGLPPPSYRRLYSLAVDRRIPALRIGASWHLRRDDLPKIARALGLIASNKTVA